MRKCKALVSSCAIVFLGTALQFAYAPMVHAQDPEDPCSHLPNPPGNAKGIHKKCAAPRTSSSGVAKGDFNGDGIGDLAIGAPNDPVGSGPAATPDAGTVTIVYGSSGGLNATGTATTPPAQYFYLRFSVPSPAGAHFGSALAAGDFNNDGYSDLAVGAPDALNSAGQPVGLIDILYGGPSGIVVNSDQIIQNPFINASGDRFGASLAWGFFNGDSFGDLAVGIPNRDVKTTLALPGSPAKVAVDAGAVAVYFGSSTGINANSAAVQFVQQNTQIPFDASANFGDTAESGDHFGTTLTAGTFNGDTYSDLAVGVPNEELPPSNIVDSGAVHIIYGSATGLSHTGTMIINESTPGILGGSQANDHFGAAVAAGDFNNDTFADLAVGVPDKDIATNKCSGNLCKDAGAVDVIYGSANGLNPAVGSQFWAWTNGSIPSDHGVDASAHFGASLAAGLMNGDGFRDLAIGAPFANILCSNNSPLDECVNAIGLNTITAAGAVNVIYGSATGLTTAGAPALARPAAQLFHQDVNGIPGFAQPQNHYGGSLIAWNFGGPGGNQGDLAIGIPDARVTNASKGVDDFGAGAVNVLYGLASGNGLTTSGTQLWTQLSAGIPLGDGPRENGHFGAALY
jgi:hypothetical protein